MPDENKTLEMTEEGRDELVRRLEGTNRRLRQEAAHALAALARERVDLVLNVTPALIDALMLPEAQTRWECLDALSEIAVVDPELVLDAFPGAEDSLFDDASASVRLAAFRFLCCYGAIAPECAAEAWPLLSEAVQCYHGDPEYREMLVCLREFARGDLGGDVKESLVARMSFDAQNGRGLMKAYSAEICSIVTEEA